MIGVDGSYVFGFNISGRSDFIANDDLAQFTLIEEAGNVLPTFALGFVSSDETIFYKLHEGNDLLVSFGSDRSSLSESPLAVTSLKSAPQGSIKRIISVTGVYSALKYMSSPQIQITDSKSAVEVIRDTARKNFLVDFNITKSNDSQRWIQHSNSDRNFINELWLHSDLGTSFAAVGISSDGKFILKDIRSELKKTPKWRFIANATNPDRDIPYDGDLVVESNTGFLNSWVGYGRDRTVYNIDTSEESTIGAETSPVLAVTKELAKRADVAKRYGATLAIDDNVHPNYWSSYDNNLIKLASMGNIRIILSFHNRFVPIRVLDIVSFVDRDVANNGVSGFYSGQYIVSKVSRTISNGQFSTLVTLCRESFNEIRNQ